MAVPCGTLGAGNHPPLLKVPRVSRHVTNITTARNAHVHRPHAQVAIKRMSRVFQDLVDAKRILREIKLLRHLGAHENVVNVLDIMTGPPDVEDFHTLYVVTQAFECDLARIIKSNQALTEQHAQYFVYQILVRLVTCLAGGGAGGGG